MLKILQSHSHAINTIRSLFQPLLGGVVNDEVIHIFSEQFAGHGDGNRSVHLVTGEYPYLRAAPWHRGL